MATGRIARTDRSDLGSLELACGCKTNQDHVAQCMVRSIGDLIPTAYWVDRPGDSSTERDDLFALEQAGGIREDGEGLEPGPFGVGDSIGQEFASGRHAA